MAAGDELFKMQRQDAARGWCAHNVSRINDDLHHFITVLTQVAVAAEIAVIEAEDMPELMGHGIA